MLKTALASDVISTRLTLLDELDSSPRISLLQRAQFRLRVFGVVEALDRGDIPLATAADLLAQVQGDVAAALAETEAAYT